MKDKWKIAIGERPLSALGKLDEFLLGGREFSHTFIALISPKGEVVEELHGKPLNVNNGKFDDIIKLHQIFNIFSSKLDEIVSTSAPEKLKVLFGEGQKLSEDDLDTTTYAPILHGDESEIMDKWTDALLKADVLNSMEIDYLAISVSSTKQGQNCHSVTSDILLSLGIEQDESDAFLHESYIRPGFRRELSSKVPDKPDNYKRDEAFNSNIRNRLKIEAIPLKVSDKKHGKRQPVSYAF